jgi:uncharacterized protein (DUF1778 family)
MPVRRRQEQRQNGRVTKDTQFNIRMAPDNKRKVERAAKVAKQTLTEFAESAVLDRAEEILAHHERILLSDRDFDIFVCIMEGDTVPTRTAIREAKEFSRGRMEGSRYHW